MTGEPRSGRERRFRESVLFLHIPKTAGTTLQAIIAQQYPAGSVYTIGTDINDAIVRFRKLPQSERSRLRVLQGHMSFGLDTSMPPPATYVAVLRNPLRRALSDYAFVRSTPQHPLFATVKDMTLRQYMQSNLTGQLSNGQTRLLCGDSLPDDTGIPTLRDLGEADLRTAMHNLDTRFAVVGLQERFDETLLLLKRRLGWRFPFYVRRNVTRPERRIRALSPEDRALIEEQNQLDTALYGHACARFEREVQAQGVSFRLELVLFRAMNRCYRLLRALEWKQLRFRLGTMRQRWRTGRRAASP